MAIMSSPIRSREDSFDDHDPLSYAPQWARGSPPAAPSPASADAPPAAPGIANPPPTVPATTDRSPVAPRGVVAPLTTPRIANPPPKAPETESPHVALPPPPPPFQGDVAIKDLRRQLALDPGLVPQPPSRNSQSRSMSMSSSSERAAGTQGPTQLAPRWARDPNQAGGPAAVQPAN